MNHKDKASCIDAYYVEMYIPIQGFNSKPININCLLQHIDPDQIIHYSIFKIILFEL